MDYSLQDACPACHQTNLEYFGWTDDDETRPLDWYWCEDCQVSFLVDKCIQVQVDYDNEDD